jgi:hypothetical protein
VALAAVNSVGKAGGFLGPLSFGVLKAATGSYLPSILLVGAALLGGGGLALAYRSPEAAQGHQGQGHTERGHNSSSSSSVDWRQQLRRWLRLGKGGSGGGSAAQHGYELAVSGRGDCGDGNQQLRA